MIDMGMLESAREAAISATAEQLSDAEVAHYRFNIAYAIRKRIEMLFPDFPAEDRAILADEIAAQFRDGETLVDACIRFSRDKIRADLEAEALAPEYAMNDAGNGERFAKNHVEKFRYLLDRNIWRRWDGKRWKDAHDSDLTKAAKRTVNKMLSEALKNEDDDLKSWSLSSLSCRMTSNMITSASSLSALHAEMEHFDQNPDLLNVTNGTIDLRTGTLYPHLREDMITTLTKINYDPLAVCPRWEQFLNEVFAGDQGLIDFVQRAVGYSLTAHTSEHAFFILHGSGRNGKGSFITQLDALLGDAAKTTRFQTFTSRDGDGGNTPALAALVGARLVSAGEPDAGVKLSESTIKMLTGGDQISVCRKYESPFSYTPTYKIWLHTNHKPAIRGTDTGIWSRPRMIPFNVTFKSKEEFDNDRSAQNSERKDPDRKLDKKLKAERPGILAWAVRGAMAWYRQGLGRCETIEKATREYREESDQLAPFIEECVKNKEGGFVTNEALYETYQKWCERNLIDHRLEGRWLARQLIARGFVSGKSKHTRGFKGIVLIYLKGFAIVAPDDPSPPTTPPPSPPPLPTVTN